MGWFNPRFQWCCFRAYDFFSCFFWIWPLTFPLVPELFFSLHAPYHLLLKFSQNIVDKNGSIAIFPGTSAKSYDFHGLVLLDND